MSQSITKKLAKKYTKQSTKKPKRVKTSIYVEKSIFQAFMKSAGRGEASRILEEFMGEFVELKGK